MPWRAALKTCQRYGAELASVHSDSENEWVARWLNEGPADEQHSRWLGMRRDPKKSNKFEWSDGTPVDYENWYEGEPNNMGKDENCVATMGKPKYGEPGRYQWNDSDCKRKYKFVCKLCECP